MDSSKIMPKVFLWMFIGLAVTFLTGSYIANDPALILDLFTGGSVFIIFILEIVLVVFLSAKIHKMKATTAKIMFMLYYINNECLLNNSTYNVSIWSYWIYYKIRFNKIKYILIYGNNRNTYNDDS